MTLERYSDLQSSQIENERSFNADTALALGRRVHILEIMALESNSTELSAREFTVCGKCTTIDECEKRELCDYPNNLQA